MRKIPSIWLLGWLQFMSISYVAPKAIFLDSSTCVFKIYKFDTETLYEITWTGKQLPIICKLSFVSWAKEVYDRHKVCAEVTQYNITACNVFLKYYEGFSRTPVKTYSCGNSIPEKHCAPEDTYFDVEFDVPLFYTDTSSKVVIRMTSNQTKSGKTTKIDDTSNVGAIIGYIFLGIVVVGVGVSLCIFLIVKRQQRTPKPTPVPAPDQNQPNAYNGQQGIQNQGNTDYNPIYEEVKYRNGGVARPADFVEHYYESVHLDDSVRPNPTAPAMESAVPQEQNSQGPPTSD